MPSNPFDQFDGPTANPFDQFDEEQQKNKKVVSTPNDANPFVQFGKDTLGTGAALVDVVAGIPKAAVATMAAPMARLIGGERGRSFNADELRNAAQAAMEDVVPSMGALGGQDGVSTNPGYKAVMNIATLPGEAINWLGEKVGGVTGSREAAGVSKLALDAASFGVGIPGAKLVGKGLAKLAETVDPALRNAGTNITARTTKARAMAEAQAAKEAPIIPETPVTSVESIPEYVSLMRRKEQLKGKITKEAKAELADLDQRAKELNIEAYNKAVKERQLASESAFNPDVQEQIRQEGLKKQLGAKQEEMFGVPELFDLEQGKGEVGGEVPMSRMEGTQGELFGRPENFELTSPEGRTPGELPPTPIRGTTPDLFGQRELFDLVSPQGHTMKPGFKHFKGKQEPLFTEPPPEHMNGLRIPDGKGGERPLTKVEYNTTVRKLAADPNTKFELPENLNQAYKAYLDQTHERVIDMFSGPGEAASFKQMLDTTSKKNENITQDQIIELGSGLTPPKYIRDIMDRFLRGMENDITAGIGNATIPTNPSIKEALIQAKGEADGKLWNLTQSGGTSAAYKTGSTMINTTRLLVQNAGKRADAAIRAYVFPVESAIRKLSKQEVIELNDVFKNEDVVGRKFHPDVLTESLSVKQLEAYEKMRSMFDRAFEAQNAERIAKGQPEITRREAYMASKWVGDFKHPVYEMGNNADGTPNPKLVWYLAANSRRGIKAQWEALKKDNPNLKLGDEQITRHTTGQTDMQSMYTKMLDILGRDDPAVERFRKLFEDQQIIEAEATKGQSKHFENKAGIRGFVGDRPGFDPFRDSLEMFQQNIQYAKNAFSWSEMQKAADGVKQLLSDKELNQTQPNNVSYVREYFKNALGQSESAATRGLSDGLAKVTGVSPKVLQEAIGNVKGLFILQKIGVSTGFALANVIQSTNVIPYLMHMTTEGYGSKTGIIKAVALGASTGIMMTTAHYLKATGGSYMDALPNQFYKDMFKYAEENGVNSRSIYDESPLSHSFGPTATAGRTVAQTIAIPETFVRSTAFATYALMLKESGKFTDMSKLFQKAEDYVNLSMVDYRASEKPIMFNKLGTTGNLLNTLQTYPISFYNQYAHMTKYMVDGFKEGKPYAMAPFLAMLAMQYQTAGAMGMPFANDAYKLYMWAKDQLPAEYWQSAQESPLASDPKLWLMENLGNASVYGTLSDKTGLGLSAKVSAPSPSEMLQSPIGPIIDLAKQGGKWAKVIADPANATKWIEAARASSFPSVQGLIDTSSLGEGITFNTRPTGEKVTLKPSDLASREGQYARTAKEESIRRWGLRPQSEVISNEVLYDLKHQATVGAEKTKDVVEKFYDAARKGDKDRARELSNLYTRMTGKEISDTQMDNQVKQEYMTAIEKAQGAPTMTLQQLHNLARFKAVMKDVK